MTISIRPRSAGDRRPLSRLLILAKEKTVQLYLAGIPTAVPDIRKGIRTKAS